MRVLMATLKPWECAFSGTPPCATRVAAEHIEFLTSGRGAPLLILDECHGLKNPKTMSTKALLHMVERIPGFVGCTAALRRPAPPLICTTCKGSGSGDPRTPPLRLASWLQHSLSHHGESMMELVAIQMRSAGCYVARQLDSSGISVRKREVALSTEDYHRYDRCVKHFRAQGIYGGRRTRPFFQRILTRSKVPAAIEETRSYLRQGYSVVVSVVSTGSAAQERRRHETNDDLSVVSDTVSFVDEVEDLEGVSRNTIDLFLDEFGAESVAELSGRLQQASTLEAEREAFQTGRKHIAVISRAGGIGISLHDADGRRRVHIVLEYPGAPKSLCSKSDGRTDPPREPPEIILLSALIQRRYDSPLHCPKDAKHGSAHQGRSELLRRHVHVRYGVEDAHAADRRAPDDVCPTCQRRPRGGPSKRKGDLPTLGHPRRQRRVGYATTFSSRFTSWNASITTTGSHTRFAPGSRPRVRKPCRISWRRSEARGLPRSIDSSPPDTKSSAHAPAAHAPPRVRQHAWRAFQIALVHEIARHLSTRTCDELQVTAEVARRARHLFRK